MFKTSSLNRRAIAAVMSAFALTGGLAMLQTAQAAPPSFFTFESGHVRPLAMSPDGTKLFATNTPNNTLDIFNITATGLQLVARVPVGLEPVAVAARSNTEVWVVNHLSDSVSVVSLSGTPRVVRTLLVGDEPRDIVFAGSTAKAFITTAHRGQHRLDPSIASVPGAGDPQLLTPGVSRADVWVFNPASLGNTMGGTPMRIMSFFADTPRALAVSPDKNTLYVAAFKSGNQTTSIFEEFVCDHFELNKTCEVNGKTMPGGRLGPATNVEGKPAPRTGMMLKYNVTNGKWEDVAGRDWSTTVAFNLPDKDVFAVDANTMTQKVAFKGVGNVLFNMVTNPVNGKLYVSNTEANNMTRFEGPGIYGGSTVQGKIALSRVTVISNPTVTPRHLNKHIDYSKLANNPAFDPTAKQHSLATPLEMAVTKNGQTLYVAAYGSSKIGVFNTAELEGNSFNPRTASNNYITVSGGGPSGLVLDETRGRMYVMTRFDNAVKVVNLATKTEVAKASLNNPEPAHIVAGRPMMYDANISSANGEASCSSCHIFGDTDEIGWDLGNPDDVVAKSPIPGEFTTPKIIYEGAKLIFGVKTQINGSDDPKDFHPIKGPMVTQTLRGMRNSGAMHWRGDRSNGMFGLSAMDSTLSFKNFAPAFEGLLGNPAPMSEAGMELFAKFQLDVQMPPNPIRNLDNSLTVEQKRGFDFYFGDRPVDGFKVELGTGESFIPNHNCNGCHTLDAAKGLYGTSGNQSFEGISQIFKIAQLRNMYQKVGRFGFTSIPFSSAKDTGHLGDQVRGFGFVHDGTVDTLRHFFTVAVFRPTLNSGFPMFDPDAARRDVEAYMMAFDADLAPIVGQQVTLTATNSSAVLPRITLMQTRAKTPFVSKELGGTATECDLVAHVVISGKRTGYYFDPVASSYVAANGSKRTVTSLRALALVSGQEVTFTCTPPGSGKRIAYSS
jgi:DNA-binding beta-propeller fold protein YncE